MVYDEQIVAAIAIEIAKRGNAIAKLGVARNGE